MSITFSSDAPANISEKESPCMCAQMAELWTDFYNGQDTPQIRENLKEQASPTCHYCQGTGVEIEKQDDAPMMNLANPNAMILLSILGLPQEYSGEISL